jgi:hypothetical protein
MWMSGVAEAVNTELTQAWQQAYYEVRLQGRLTAALDLGYHPRKRVLALTRAENESRGRTVKRWGDGY